ncbi:ATP-binding protein [Salipaludibacillus sp. HK11]|uniref:sensor histidine kinase n=1 Tax=Salipaludibacillus sp. HK11 TaxID=3394320 RepID=UPI0039FBF9D9
MKVFFTKMTFRSKIFSALLLTTVLFSSFSFVLIQSMDEMNQVSDDLSNRNIPELIWLTQWEENLTVKEYMVETAIQSDFCCQFIDRYDAYQIQMDKQLTKDYDEAPPEVEDLKREMDLLDFMITNDVRGLINFESEQAAVRIIEEQYLPQLNELRLDLRAEREGLLSSLEGHSTRLSNIIKESMWLLLMLTSISIVLAIVASYRISKGLTKPIEKIRNRLGHIAKGQYGLSVEEVDQIELKSLTTSINQMSSRLKDSFETINDDKIYREQILNSLPIGIVTLDEKQGDIALNNAAKKLLVNSDGKIKTLQGDPYGESNHDFWNAFSSNEIFRNVKLTFQTEEKYRSLLVSQSQLINREKVEIGQVFYFVDITKTEELAKKMQHTEKLALVGELSAGAAHEIRNPLAVIDGFLSLMNQSLSNEQKEQFRIPLLLKEIDRINTIIEEMLLLTKPSVPNLKLTYLQDIIDDILPLIQRTISNQSISFTIQLNSTPLFVDGEQMKQVLHNLIRNSTEALDGKGDISITSYTKGEMCQIFLEDNGPGISEQMKKQIFNPFLTTKENGTGLGLTIAQRILDNHEGKLELVSSSERGTCFLIEVPIVLGEK